MGISVGNAIPAGFSERSETKQAAYYAAEVRKLIVLRLFGFILASGFWLLASGLFSITAENKSC